MDNNRRVSTRNCACCGDGVTCNYMYSVNQCAIWKCLSCGTGQVEVDAFDPKTYYTQDYFNGTHVDGYSNYFESAEALRFEFSRILRYLRNYSQNGGRLLEIGCAYGFFLDQAKNFFDVYGLELATAAVDECHKKGLNQVIAGELNREVIDFVGFYDVLVMLDVIEHLTNPKKVLAMAVSHLRPGGVVLLTTGDYGSFLSRLSGRRWRLMTPPQHLWFFTIAGIRKMAQELGLELLSVDHPWKFVPLSLVVYQSMRIFGIKPRNLAFMPSNVPLPINLFDAMRVVMRKI